MNACNDKGERHGPWEVNYPSGNLWYKQNYVNGQEHGLCEVYYKGNLYFKGNFVNGKKHGLCDEYNTNGELNLKQYYL